MPLLSLSSCWNSSRHTDGAEMLREIRDMGFTRAELGHGIRFSLWPGVLEALEQRVIEISSLHNFCPVPMGILKPSPNCYELTDPNPRLRQSAVNSTLDTIRNAAKLGVPAVVVHLGSSGQKNISRALEKEYQKGHQLDRGYVSTKINALTERRALFDSVWERLQESLKPIVDEAGQLGIKLGFENRERFEEFPDEEEFPAVLEALPPEVVGYWHDFGHAARKEYLGWHDHEQTLALRSPRILGCHIHDCRPPDEDHLPLGTGEIAFSQLLPHVPDTAITVLELAPSVTKEAVIASHDLWKILRPQVGNPACAVTPV